MTQLPYPETHEDVLTLKQEYTRKNAAKKIEKMHVLYGVSAGNLCMDCKHLFCHERSRHWYKCKLYGITGGPGTDWRVKWTACGKFEAGQ
jgi:hypothetical protein